MARQSPRTRKANARARSSYVAAPASNTHARGVTFHADGSRTVHLTGHGADQMRAHLEATRERYLQVWSRPMRDSDPLFPDYDAPAPRPMDTSKAEAMMVEAMTPAGWDPAFIYAYQCTHVLVTEANEDLVDPDDLAEWSAAVKRYRALHG